MQSKIVREFLKLLSKRVLIGIVHGALRKNLSPGRYASGMIVCHDDNIRYILTDNMQCSSNKRVISQISLTCFYVLYIYIHAFLHFSLIFFFSTLNLISFWSSGQSRVRVVHFGAFALPQFVSKTAWQISRPESKIILGDLNCEICQNAKCLWTSEASHPPILPEDEDEIEVSSYCKDGVSLSTPP